MKKRDLRDLYTVQVAVVDDAGREELVQELQSTKRELNALALRYDVLLSKYEALKKATAPIGSAVTGSGAGGGGGGTPTTSLMLVARVQTDGESRVGHHSLRDASLLFSHGSDIGRISLLEGAGRNPTYLDVHRYGAVRDICSRPNDDLVVSCDSSEVVIWNSESGNVVHRLNPNINVCTWDACNVHEFHVASRNTVLTYDLRRLDKNLLNFTMPHPQPVHRLLSIATPSGPQLISGSLGGVCDVHRRAIIVEGAIYSIAYGNESLICSYRQPNGPGMHLVHRRDPADFNRWLVQKQFTARQPNAVLSRTSVAKGLFAAGDGETLDVWDLKAAARLVETPTSQALTDAVICAEPHGRTFVAAIGTSRVDLLQLRVAQ